MEQLRPQNAEKINLNRILEAVNALSESENNFTKDTKNLFRLRKEIYNSATKDIKN